MPLPFICCKWITGVFVIRWCQYCAVSLLWVLLKLCCKCGEGEMKMSGEMHEFTASFPLWTEMLVDAITVFLKVQHSQSRTPSLVLARAFITYFIFYFCFSYRLHSAYLTHFSRNTPNQCKNVIQVCRLLA